MEKFKRNIAKLYEEGGIFEKGTWKKETDLIFGPEQVKNLYQLMQKREIIPPPDKEIVFLSPTANIPTHEISFFEKDKETRRAKGLFLVGDISELELQQDQVQRTSQDHHFQYFRWDAEHLPIKDRSVDVIWDRKGWLWHCANRKDIERLLETFQQYQKLLKDGGSIIVDNIPGYEQLVENLSAGEQMKILWIKLLAISRIKKIKHSDTFPKRSTQYEPSTVDKIRQIKSYENVDILRKLAEWFEIFDIGQGIERVLIFKKRFSPENKV
ncbi:MAG: class I SAM-dependent methyltransferase [bacterium]|nr:class I SAM-dependent methyltransferase [bacterium]